MRSRIKKCHLSLSSQKRGELPVTRSVFSKNRIFDGLLGNRSPAPSVCNHFSDKTFLPANRTYPPSKKSLQDTFCYFLPAFRFEGFDSKMGFHGPFRCTQMAAIVDLIFLRKGRPWHRTVQRPQRQPYVDLQHGFFGEARREPFLTISAFQP